MIMHGNDSDREHAAVQHTIIVYLRGNSLHKVVKVRGSIGRSHMQRMFSRCDLDKADGGIRTLIAARRWRPYIFGMKDKNSFRMIRIKSLFAAKNRNHHHRKCPQS
jgi:hypothetical protein